MMAVLGCAGNKAHSEQALTPAAGQANPESAQHSPEKTKVEALLYDVLAHMGCRELEGRYVGLSAAEGGDGADVPRVGLLWIESCNGESRAADGVQIELGGRGIRYVDRETEKLGARFAVSQYVPFRYSMTLVGRISVRYAREQQVATVRFLTSAPVEASVQPLREPDVAAKGVWADLLGSAGALIGKSQGAEAVDTMEEEGPQELRDELGAGLSVAVDLCTGQEYITLGRLARGELPEQPFEARGRRFALNERVRLHPHGLDLAGPVDQPGPLTVEVDVEQGPGVRLRAICLEEARRLAEAFMSEDPAVPEVRALAELVARPGARQKLDVPAADCPVVIVGRSADPEALVEYRYLAQAQARGPRSLVECREREE
jgi:hypothetical protein